MRKIIVAGSVFAFSAAVGAAQLGTLSVTSMLNEPMKATLEVKDVPADISKVKVGLASLAVYRSLGKTYADELRDISVSVVSKSPYRIRLVSSRPVKTADFPVILVLDDNGRRAAKLYNLHFVERSDSLKAAAKGSGTLQTPARLEASRKDAEDAAQNVKAKVDQARDKVSAVPSAATKAAAQEQLRSVPSAKQSASKAAAETAKPAAAPKKEVKAAAQKTQAAAKSAQSKDSSAPETREKPLADGATNIPVNGKRATVQVTEGTTLWSVLKPYVQRYPGAIMQQLIVQTIRSNPSCFEGGRSSGVVFGCRMVLPKRIRVSREDALFYVNEHPDWDATKPVGDQTAERAAHADVRQGGATPSDSSAAKPAVDKPKAIDKPKAVEEKPAPAAGVKKQDSVQEKQPAASNEDASRTNDKTLEEKPRQQAADQQPAKDVLPVAADASAKMAKSGLMLIQKALGVVKSEVPLGWVLGSLLVILASIGFGYSMGRRRRSEPAAPAAGAVATVAFREPSPTTQEQLDGASRMLENRLRADEAAARGFPDVSRAAAPQTPGPEVQGQPVDPAVRMTVLPEEQAPVQAEPQPEQSGLVRISRPSQPAQEAPKSPFPTVPTGMAAVEPEEKQLAKLEKARAYMAVGANAQAQELLEDVVKTSTGRVQQMASELMAMLEQKK